MTETWFVEISIGRIVVGGGGQSAAQHRGSIDASLPAAPSSNLSTLNFFLMNFWAQCSQEQ